MNVRNTKQAVVVNAQLHAIKSLTFSSSGRNKLQCEDESEGEQSCGQQHVRLEGDLSLLKEMCEWIIKSAEWRARRELRCFPPGATTLSKSLANWKETALAGDGDGEITPRRAAVKREGGKSRKRAFLQA